MLRARTLAAQCLRREAATRSRCSRRSAGAACAAAMPTPNSSRVVRAGCTLRRCLQSDATAAAAATTHSDGSGGLMQHSDVAAQESQEAGALRTAPAPDPALRFDFDDDVAGLVERLNYLGTHSCDNTNQNNGPSAAQEGLQLLQAAHSRGMKDARLYKAVFKLLSVTTNAAVITSLSEQMKQDGIKADLETHNLIIYGYASSKDVAGARRAYEELLSSGFEANETTLSNMVVANSWKDIDEMRRVFGELRERKMAPTKAAYQSMISGLRIGEDWQGISTIINEMLEEGVVPTEAGFAVGFLTARKLGDVEFAKMLLERRSQAGMSPRQDFFVNVMVTLGEAGKPEESLEYWRRLVCVQGIDGLGIRPETFYLALRTAVKIKAWDEVEAIIGMMQEDGRPMDEKVHNVLMGRRQAVSKDPAHVERLLKVLQQMEAYSGRGLTPMCQLQLAVVCSDAGMHDRAMPLFESAQREGVLFGKFHKPPLLSTLVALGRFEGARMEWRQADWVNKKEFTGSTFQAFMKAAEGLKDADWALELHEQSLKHKRKHARWFHPIALQVLAEAGRLEEAFGIAETLRTSGHPKLPPTSYHVLCRCCKQHGEKELVVKVVQTMRKGTMSLYLPPPDVLGFVVEAFIERGIPGEVLTLFDRMRAQRIQPNPEVYVLLADAAVAANDLHQTVHFAGMAEKGGRKASAGALAFTQSKKLFNQTE